MMLQCIADVIIEETSVDGCTGIAFEELTSPVTGSLKDRRAPNNRLNACSVSWESPRNSVSGITSRRRSPLSGASSLNVRVKTGRRDALMLASRSLKHHLVRTHYVVFVGSRRRQSDADAFTVLSLRGRRRVERIHSSPCSSFVVETRRASL